MNTIIRPIQQPDNPGIEQLIRLVLTEFGANRPGFAWSDPELSNMFHSYSQPGTLYYVIQHDNKLLGGAGIAPFNDDQPGVCELQKMYLHPDARGKGLGSQLITTLLQDARTMGYERCYLETLATMTDAQRLYQQQGFRPLKAPIAPGIHHGCDCWMICDL
ncbi:MAG: GNAT family N-acetyltransferase [Motiliproteus sp.]